MLAEVQAQVDDRILGNGLVFAVRARNRATQLAKKDLVVEAVTVLAFLAVLGAPAGDM